VMDALTTSNLEDTLRLNEKPVEIFEKNWDKMNRTVCGLIRSYLIQDNFDVVKFMVRTILECGGVR